TSDGGAAIRRRRACLLCGRRYTTFERVEDVVLIVRKRSGGQEPFDQTKLLSGIQRAAKNRPIAPEAIDELVDEVTSLVRAAGPGRVAAAGGGPSPPTAASANTPSTIAPRRARPARTRPRARAGADAGCHAGTPWMGTAATTPGRIRPTTTGRTATVHSVPR